MIITNRIIEARRSKFIRKSATVADLTRNQINLGSAAASIKEVYDAPQNTFRPDTHRLCLDSDGSSCSDWGLRRLLDLPRRSSRTNRKAKRTNTEKRISSDSNGSRSYCNEQ